MLSPNLEECLELATDTYYNAEFHGFFSPRMHANDTMLRSFGSASSKMLHVVAPSLSLVSSQPYTSKDAKSASNATMDLDVDLPTRARIFPLQCRSSFFGRRNSTMKLRQRKKMQVLHDRKCCKLK